MMLNVCGDRKVYRDRQSRDRRPYQRMPIKSCLYMVTVNHGESQHLTKDKTVHHGVSNHGKQHVCWDSLLDNLLDRLLENKNVTTFPTRLTHAGRRRHRHPRTLAHADRQTRRPAMEMLPRNCSTLDKQHPHSISTHAGTHRHRQADTHATRETLPRNFSTLDNTTSAFSINY